MSMRACDRCHRGKERCLKPNGSDTCARCLRLDLPCHTLRPEKRSGRVPSSARHITYQKLSILSQPSAQTQVENTPFGSNESRGSRGSHLSAAGASDNAAGGEGRSGVDGAESTDRVGRPSSSDDASSRGSLDHIDTATDQELYLLSLALGDKRSTGRYVIGPSFHERHQQSLIKGLQTAPALLKDAFISCSTLIAAEQGIEVPVPIQEHCQRRAAMGVSVLRSVKVTNQDDAASCILLGFLLITFAKYVALGEVLAICRYTLDQIKPIYEANRNFCDEDHRCFLSHLVLTETIECLFEAEIPVLRLEGEQNEIDRFLGVSSSLLPSLHSLARLNCMLQKSEGPSRWNLYQEAIKFEMRLLEWTPPQMDDIRDHFEPQEVNYMLRQARVMKETMLLIAHRLQFAYGSRATPEAEQRSHSISNELEQLKAETGQTLNIAGLSLMAASFEVQVDDSTGQTEALDRLERLTSLSSSFRSRLKRSLFKFWSAKEQQQAQQKGWYWYDVSRCYLSPLSDS